MSAAEAPERRNAPGAVFARSGGTSAWSGSMFAAALVAIAAGGAALRTWHLGEQVLIGDELHALNAAVARGIAENWSHWTYAGADYSVPLALFYGALLKAGVALSEAWLRAPALTCGIATLWVVPWLVRRRIGDAASLVLAALLALSPLLVVYSRMVRSYAPLVLTAVCAVLLFHEWWRNGGRGRAGATALACGLAVWLHLGAVPLVAGMFGWALLQRALRRPGGQPIGALAALAAATSVATGLVLLPAARSLVALFDLHGQSALPSARTLAEMVRLLAGHAHPLALALLAAAFGRGALVLGAREPGWLGYLGFVALAHLVGLAILAPQHLDALQVITRYALPLLPLLLVPCAVGVATPLARVGPRLQAVGVAGLLLALGLSGPLASERFATSPFTHAPMAITFAAQQDRMRAEDVPRIYRELGAACGHAARCPGAVIEAPWLNAGHHAYAVYQRVHRHPVRLVSLNRLHADPRLALRNTLPRDPERWLAGDARLLIVHTDLGAEEARVESHLFGFRERLERLDTFWTALRRAGERLAADLRSEWGPPDVEEPGLLVWNLDRVRAARSHASG